MLEKINLSNYQLASYEIEFEINRCYKISNPLKIRSTNQIFFKRFTNLKQYRNLAFVDSFFPVMLSEIIKQLIVYRTTTFAAFLNKLKKESKEKDSQVYNLHKYKIYNFIHLLLYTNLSSKNVFEEKYHYNRVFQTEFDEKNTTFTIYERNILQLLLIEKIELEIDFESIKINRNSLKLELLIKV